MTDNDDETPSQSRWNVVVVSVRAVLTAAVLVAMYYLLPLDTSGSDTAVIVKLALGGLVFVGLMLWQLRAIAQSKNPGLRALEGLFLAIPLFLLLFASAYYLMGQGDPADFTAPLTRTDALYFTVTIFSTVGFGDISAKAQAARLVVTAQMFLDLVILGLGARIILGAVQRGRERLTTDTTASVPSP